MFDKLISLFKDTYGEPPREAQPRAIRPNRFPELESEVQENQPVPESLDKGSLIGYNYLKGMDDEEPETRKFVNLSKFLRGDYKNG